MNIAQRVSSQQQPHAVCQQPIGLAGELDSLPDRDHPVEDGPMLRFVDVMTQQQAKQIYAAITMFIVCCALPFAIVENKYFKELLRTLRPAFIDQGHLKSRTRFSRTGLKDLYDATVDRIKSLFQALAMHTYMALAGDGLKSEVGHKVVNFTEQLPGRIAFKTSVSVDVTRENEAFYMSNSS